MKYVFIIALTMMAACKRDVQTIPAQISTMTGAIFANVSPQLDYSTMKTITGKEGVLVYVFQFRGDTNQVYATSSRGEILYERHMQDRTNGYFELTKGSETIRVNFVNGIRTVENANLRTMQKKPHGGTGFCQREAKEDFRTCFKEECDEFCDSFVSCIALATQPTVSILIGIACSCQASTDQP